MLTFKHHGMMIAVDVDRNSDDFDELVEKYGEDNVFIRNYMTKRYRVVQNGKATYQNVPFKSIYQMNGHELKSPMNRHQRRELLSQNKFRGPGYTKTTLNKRKKSRRMS